MEFRLGTTSLNNVANAGRARVIHACIASRITLGLLVVVGNLLMAFQATRGVAQQLPDRMRQLQFQAVVLDSAAWGFWGARPNTYVGFSSHSNRLIPIYVFGSKLSDYVGDRSVYRNAEALKRIYGEEPLDTVNPDAVYCDQTDIFRLQQAAVAAGKKHVFLLIFDGMDWQTTRAAALYRQGKVAYEMGRGTGLAFQDYQPANSDFGWMVTSASHASAKIDVNLQSAQIDSRFLGGYNAEIGGPTPWTTGVSSTYLMGQTSRPKHLVTDSASSASSMCSGIKTYNSAINVTADGNQVEPVARTLQKQGWRIGVVTSVPISHATPASAYANNVDRDDYQDLTRDLIGTPSISHSDSLPGVDVLIGGGWGENSKSDSAQGNNFQPGNRFLPGEDLALIQQRDVHPFVVAQRTPGQKGIEVLRAGTQLAIQENKSFLGFFGTMGGHFPYQTADGRFDPTRGSNKADVYSVADVTENPNLADCTSAAIEILSAQANRPFWLMVEAGDVDWANHNNNLDDSIGAVFSGEAAFQTIVTWVETHSNWNDSILIVTSDHGHMFNIVEPDVIANASR